VRPGTSRIGLGALALIAATAGCSGTHHGPQVANSSATGFTGAPTSSEPSAPGGTVVEGGGSGPALQTPAPEACSSPSDGGALRTFCGSGTLSLTLGQDSETVGGADCEIDATSVTIDAGTLVLTADPKLKDQYLYVGVQVGRTAAASTSTPAAPADGTYPALMSISDHGVVASVPQGVAVLTSNRLRGVITGKSLSGAPVRVTYAC